VERLESGYSVMLIDVRYYRPESGTAFGAEVILDDSLQSIREQMGFSLPARIGEH
jgi:hypothetical protein